MSGAGGQLYKKQCPELCPATAHSVLYAQEYSSQTIMSAFDLVLLACHFPAFDRAMSARSTLLFSCKKKKSSTGLKIKMINTASVSGRQQRGLWRTV